MQVTYDFDVSLTSPVITTIPVMQGDGVRLIVARLMEGREPWVVPEGVRAGLSYELPGKNPGYYDKRNDGAPACVIDGSQVSVVIEPTLTERAGFVKASIVLRDPEGVQVAMFPFHLWVKRVPGMVHGENLEPPSHVFDGKIYYGGPGGILLPLGLGNGIQVEQQEDSSLLLVAESGNGGAGEEADPTVPDWAKQPQKPGYTAQEVGADPAGKAQELVGSHETNLAAHPYFHEQIAELRNSKMSVADIVDNLVTNATNKPLSAAQGMVLKNLIDLTDSRLVEAMDERVKKTELPGAIEDALEQAEPGLVQAVIEALPKYAGEVIA